MKLILKSLITFTGILLFAQASFAANFKTGGWQKNRIGDMDYWLYTPASLAHSNARASLMLSLHGCWSNADEMKTYGNWAGAAERYRMVIALPEVPKQSAVPGCWDAILSDHVQTTSHTQKLVGLIGELMRTPGLKINMNSVFASGLSAGATQTMALGCARPDLIAGVAVASGPVIGSAPDEVFSPKTSSARAASVCLSMAGQRAGYLATQKASFIVSDIDWVVNSRHTLLTYGALKSIYRVSSERTLSLGRIPGTSHNGSGTEAFDSRGHLRISLIVQNDLGHAWAAGGGRIPDEEKFFSNESVNYPLYLGEFFTTRRLR